MRFRYDKSSKWLIEHHGDSILRLGGVGPIVSWRAIFSELVQPRQLPDGLIEARLVGRPKADLFLVELTTYPYSSIPAELLDDLLLVYLDRHQLPELLTIVLHPKGNVEVSRDKRVQSPLGWTSLLASWRVVELWTLPAAPLLAADDPGLAPWIPLLLSDMPPEVILRQCRDLIDRKAKPEEHENLLVVAQILAGLRYDDEGLLSIFGGKKTMIESPVLMRLLAEKEAQGLHRGIRAMLRARFSAIPPEILAALEGILDRERLEELNVWAARCPDLEGFAARLQNPN